MSRRKPTHGGKRPGAGRKPKGAEALRTVALALGPEEEARIAQYIVNHSGETPMSRSEAVRRMLAIYPPN